MFFFSCKSDDCVRRPQQQQPSKQAENLFTLLFILDRAQSKEIKWENQKGKAYCCLT